MSGIPPFRKWLSPALCLLALSLTNACGPDTAKPDPNSLRIAVMKRGTVNWEIDTINHHKLDKRYGFELKPVSFAGGSAAKIAFQGGDVDVFVADWLWVARQRAAGHDYVFLPFSKAVGGLMVAQNSPVRTLPDLKGARIGIAGGPLDKSWLILRAYAASVYDFDLADQTEPVFGAPPLIYKSALNQDIDAAINYWHFGARMKAAGMREILSTSEAASALGLDADTPLLGFVLKGEQIRTHPHLTKGLLQASRAAKALLASDNAEWERLRPLMNADNHAEFEQLRDGFRAGIPTQQPINTRAVSDMLEIMGRFGGKALLGPLKTLPDGVFYTF